MAPSGFNRQNVYRGPIPQGWPTPGQQQPPMQPPAQNAQRPMGATAARQQRMMQNFENSTGRFAPQAPQMTRPMPQGGGGWGAPVNNLPGQPPPGFDPSQYQGQDPDPGYNVPMGGSPSGSVWNWRGQASIPQGEMGQSFAPMQRQPDQMIYRKQQPKAPGNVQGLLSAPPMKR
jgi:hypothetical protein